MANWNYAASNYTNTGGTGNIAYYEATSGANTLQYVCESKNPWTALTDPQWRIRRVTIVTATGEMAAWLSVAWASGTAEFNKVATDLTTVQAYSYS